MQRVAQFSIGCVFLIAVSNIFAASPIRDLLDAYRDALKNDPTYYSQIAELRSTEQDVNASRAQLLPQLDLTADTVGVRQLATNSGRRRFNTNSYGIVLTQTVFNASQFAQLSQSKAALRAGVVLLSSQKQNLMIRAAKAYFDVLAAKELVRYTDEQRKFIWRQYWSTRERYKLGHATITDIKQSQGQYELIRSELVSAKITLYNTVQALSEITGVRYGKFALLKKNFPLVNPIPRKIEPWVNISKRQNLSLTAARLNKLAALKQIQVEKGNNWPEIQAIGTWSDGNGPVSAALGLFRQINTRSGTLGLQANWAAFQSGLTLALVRKAAAEYQKSVAEMNAAYLNTMALTRDSYIGVVDGVIRIQRSRSAVEANAQALSSSEEGYIAGTQSVFDVLQAQNRLFAAEKQLVADTYAYLNDILLLKQAAGTLKPGDLVWLNSWLNNPRKRQRARRRLTPGVGIGNIKRDTLKKLRNKLRQLQLTKHKKLHKWRLAQQQKSKPLLLSLPKPMRLMRSTQLARHQSRHQSPAHRLAKHRAKPVKRHRRRFVKHSRGSIKRHQVAGKHQRVANKHRKLVKHHELVKHSSGSIKRHQVSGKHQRVANKHRKLVKHHELVKHNSGSIKRHQVSGKHQRVANKHRKLVKHHELVKHSSGSIKRQPIIGKHKRVVNKHRKLVKHHKVVKHSGRSIKRQPIIGKHKRVVNKHRKLVKHHKVVKHSSRSIKQQPIIGKHKRVVNKHRKLVKHHKVVKHSGRSIKRQPIIGKHKRVVNKHRKLVKHHAVMPKRHTVSKHRRLHSKATTHAALQPPTSTTKAVNNVRHKESLPVHQTLKAHHHKQHHNKKPQQHAQHHHSKQLKRKHYYKKHLHAHLHHKISRPRLKSRSEPVTPYEDKSITPPLPQPQEVGGHA